ncbi:MAG TPA: DUF6062 family protein [Levilinea sp.]|nr:DUF6062 family protein [Levilinea sp.]
MAFALSVAKLVDAMKLQGCPVCRRAWQASSDSMEIFLWENVNDPRIRGEINAAYGFCDYHTRLLVSRELSNSGVVLGVNIIYELLGRIVAEELKKALLRGQVAGFLGRLLKKGARQANRILPGRDICPACKLTHQVVVNTLFTLFESLEKGVVDLREAYLESDRLCFDHLHWGLKQYAADHIVASRFLIDDAVQRLGNMSADMRGYIRKSNWEYREEKMTPDENDAWQRMLVFFTGYPAPVFSFKVPQFDQGEYHSHGDECLK